MTLIVNHLIRAGCKKIGFFGLCVEMSWSCSRYYGFLEAMAKAGQSCKPGNVVEIDLSEILRPEGPMSEKWAEEALAKTRAGVDAWVCASHGLGWQLSRFFVPSERHAIVAPRADPARQGKHATGAEVNTGGERRIHHRPWMNGAAPVSASHGAPISGRLV